jgi:hypothetical protein
LEDTLRLIFVGLVAVFQERQTFSMLPFREAASSLAWTTFFARQLALES